MSTKFTISHGQSSVQPMNMFATWDVDRSSPHCIPRVCSLALEKLLILKELDKDLQSVFLAVKMQGSKRVLRSNEIGLPANGLLSMDLELTFSLQYPHFIKRDGNILQILLQRKKRYKNRAMLGYKTLAAGTVNMAQIIQSPVVEQSTLDLVSTNKDRRSSVIVSAQVVMSSVHCTPADEIEVGIGRTGKQIEADRSPDIDNSTDDEETFSSDPEMGSDVNPQELYMDEDSSHRHKRKGRRKIRMSSTSRQQNFIKAKIAALLRKFKQVEGEGSEPDVAQDPDAAVPDPEDLDFLYNEIEDLDLSDSCPEVEDNISIESTPKPKLRPFFDRMSHSSSQTEISSLRDHNSGEQISTNQCPDSRDNTLGRHREVRETFESLQNSDKTPAIDQSDSSDQEEERNDSFDMTQPGDRFPSLNVPTTSSYEFELGSPGHYSQPISITHSKKRKKSWTLSNSPTLHMTDGKYIERTSSTEELELTSPQHQSSLLVISGSFSLDEEDSDYPCTLPCPLLLINRAECNGQYLTELFQNYLSEGNTTDSVILATSTREQMSNVFNIIVTKFQKFVNSNSQQPIRVKIGVAGTESYVNLVLQQFVEFLSSRSPDWMTYFSFLIIPLGKNRLGQYLGSLDSHYAQLFNDAAWRETFEKSRLSTKSLTPNSTSIAMDFHPGVIPFESQQNLEKTLVRRVLEYIDEASATLPVSVAEAMLTFGEKSDNEDTSQKFVPFISEAKLGEKQFLIHQDCDREDILGPVLGVASANTSASSSTPIVASTGGSTSTPSSPATIATSSAQHSSFADYKMGLQVDYWKDRDSTKYSLKTTFKSFQVSRLPALGELTHAPGLSLDVVTIGKKNIMRLPGKKGKEKEAESKPIVIPNINRIICTSKHQHSLLKVKIDGIEWKEVKFFQLSSHWSSHVKSFPVGLFSAH